MVPRGIGDVAENKQAYTVEEVVRLLGVTARTLHYYEEVGLCEPAGRTAGGHRLYDEESLSKLRHILRLKDNMGYTLQEIKVIVDAEQELARLRDSYRNAPESERVQLLDTYIALLEDVVDHIDAKVARLQTMRQTFDEQLEKSRRARSQSLPEVHP